MLDDQEKNLRPILNGERYITDSELAEKLKLTRRTLADYRTNGRLPYYKIGGKLLYKEKDILVLLEKTGWKHLIIGNTRFQVSRHKHKKVMETIKERVSWLSYYRTGRLYVFYFGIIYRSAFLFLTCKGSLLLLMRKAVLRTGWLKNHPRFAAVFFAKPCTIRAKDKCLTCKR